MAFYLAHAGTKLQKVTVAGGVSDLTLPAGVTIGHANGGTLWAMLNGSVLAVLGPSINLRIGSDLTVTPMSIPKPTSAISGSAGAAGVLTGTYYWAYSYAQRAAGTLISESPLSDASATVVLAGQRASLTGITVSSAAGVTDRRLYRVTQNGSVLFPLGYLADNTTTTYSDNATDASMSTTSVDTDLGNPPGTDTSDYLTALVAWKNRLWAVSHLTPDTVLYSGVNKWYAWSPSNALPINPVGQGASGVTAFLPRRDELGVAKRRKLSKIVGTNPTNYQVIDIAQGIGVFAPLSVVTIGDAAYFLSEDGVYVWNADGVAPLEHERTRAWFHTDDYFNRARFPYAYAKWNRVEGSYELHLASATSGVEDRWVSYDLETKRWLGPHKTDATTPQCAAALENIDGRARTVIGGADGKLYVQNSSVLLDGATAIATQIVTAYASGGDPTLLKYWGELTVLVRPTTGTLTVTPTLGNLGAMAGTARTLDLRVARARLSRLGKGELLQLQFDHSGAGEDMQLLGFSVPVGPIGRR